MIFHLSETVVSDKELANLTERPLCRRLFWLSFFPTYNEKISNEHLVLCRKTYKER